MSFYAIICKKIKRKSVCERQNKNVGRYLKISVKKQKHLNTEIQFSVEMS